MDDIEFKNICDNIIYWYSILIINKYGNKLLIINKSNDINKYVSKKIINYVDIDNLGFNNIIKTLKSTDLHKLNCSLCLSCIIKNEEYYIFNEDKSIKEQYINNINNVNHLYINKNIVLCNYCYSKCLYKIDKTHIETHINVFLTHIDIINKLMGIEQLNLDENNKYLSYAWYIYNVFENNKIPRFKKICCCLLDKKDPEYIKFTDPKNKFFNYDVLEFIKNKLTEKITTI